MRGRWRKRKRSGEEAIFHRCGESWLFDSDSHEIVVAALALERHVRAPIILIRCLPLSTPHRQNVQVTSTDLESHMTFHGVGVRMRY